METAQLTQKSLLLPSWEDVGALCWKGWGLMSSQSSQSSPSFIPRLLAFQEPCFPIKFHREKNWTQILSPAVICA